MASKKDGLPFNRMPFNKEFLANMTGYSPSQIVRIIKTFCRQQQAGDNFPNYWDAECTAEPMLLIIGDKGIGKSSIVKEAARQMNGELRRVMTGDAEAQDLMAVVDPLAQGGEDDDGKHMQYRFAHCIPLEEPKGDTGILLVDDVGGMDIKQQKVLRALITEGRSTGWYGEILAAKWHWIATSNPEDQSYFLVNELEESLRDRIIPLVMKYDEGEVLHFLATSGKIPDTIHRFLLMNKGALSEVTPRGWEYIGQMAFRHEAAHDLSRQEFVNLMRGKMPPGTVDLFSRFLVKGDNPDEYPMLAKEIATADDEKHSVHCRRMEKWAKSGKEALLGATSFDLAAKFRDTGIVYKSEELARLSDIVALIPKTDLIKQVLDASTGTDKAAVLVKHLRKRSDLADKLADMQSRHVENQRNAGT